MGGADAPAALALGLDLFVTAWLEEWARYGGSVIARPDGSGSIGWSVKPTGPGYAEPSPDLPAAVRERSRTFDSAHHSGRMRAMLDMLDAVPHARAALDAHMRAHALGCYYGQPGAAQ